MDDVYGLEFYHSACIMIILAFFTVITLVKIPAPYGKHDRKGWGPLMNVRIGWLIMESPALWMTGIVFYYGKNRKTIISLTLLFFYQLHYVHRVLIYPFRIKVERKKMPIVVALLAFVFNIFNGYLQAREISHFKTYPSEWLSSPRFIFGTVVFFTGLVTNIHSDNILIQLRTKHGGPDYVIPHGFLFNLVSCPNYLGEITEWFGWAILTSSFAGLAFFVYTLANLAPRALAHHRWYRTKFPSYPKFRKAFIPYLL